MHFEDEELMKINSELLVSDLMTRNIEAIARDADVAEAIRILERESVSALPVVDSHGRVCGILSKTDLLGLAYNLQSDVATLSYVSDSVRKSLTDAIAEDNQNAKVENIMTTTVHTLGLGTNMRDAAKCLMDHEIHHVPIVNADGKPLGMLSTVDIVRAVAYHGENKD